MVYTFRTEWDMQCSSCCTYSTYNTCSTYLRGVRKRKDRLGIRMNTQAFNIYSYLYPATVVHTIQTHITRMACITSSAYSTYNIYQGALDPRQRQLHGGHPLWPLPRGPRLGTCCRSVLHTDTNKRAYNTYSTFSNIPGSA